MLDASKELAIREALGAKVAAVTGSAFVRRPVVDSKQDWAGLGVQNIDGELELRVCTVDLQSFDDSPDYGCFDDPMVTLTYAVHVFFEFKEKRSDDSNSTDDFAAAVTSLRSSFLDADRTLASLAKVESLPLVQASFILLGDDPLTGGFGHSIDLLAKVEVS
jgi:hypothetical protein